MYDFLTEEKIKQNSFLQKIDMSFTDCGTADRGFSYYRVLDGVSSEITEHLYDAMIPKNFAEKECENKGDFQAFFEENPEIDARRENINIIVVSNAEFVGLLTGRM